MIWWHIYHIIWLAGFLPSTGSSRNRQFNNFPLGIIRHIRQRMIFWCPNHLRKDGGSLGFAAFPTTNHRFKGGKDGGFRAPCHKLIPDQRFTSVLEIL